MAGGGFFQQVAVAGGNSLLSSLAMNDQKATTDYKQAQVDESKARMAQMAQTTQTKKAVGEFIQQRMSQDKASVEDPQKAGSLFMEAAGIAAAKGDFATAHEMDTLAQGKFKEAKEKRVEVAANIQLAREDLAKKALTFSTSGAPQDATEVAKAAIAAGVNPLDIPPPNTPEFKSWAKRQETAAMSSKDQMAAAEKVREFEEREAERRKEAEERHQDREEARKDRAVAQSQSIALRRELADSSRQEREARAEERRATREGQTAFQQTEKINKEAQKAADPLIKDRTTVTNVKNLLRVDSPVADQQVREALPALLGGLKGRATGAYYKDNKTFGDVVQRVSGFMSQTFTGRYDETTRKQLFEMLDKMEKDVLDPGLTRIEDDAKARAAKYELDPDKVELQGDFTRRKAKAAPGAPAETKAGTEKVLAGVTYVFKDGSWWKK